MKPADIRMVPGTRHFNGTVRVPGDKSLSHRLAMLGALAHGDCRITGFLDSEDCLNTLAAVSALGAVVERDGTRVLIRGTGGRFRPADQPLDMGNSGTGIRLLAGLLAGHPFETVLTGDASLRSRPMNRIREPLVQMGAAIELEGTGGCAPMRIRGGALRPITYAMPVASAQVKSCVLLAGLFADGETTVVEPKPTRDHTERVFESLGVPVSVEGLRIRIRGFGVRGPDWSGRDWSVPGDFSSAAFWIAGACLFPGAVVTVEGVGLNARRTAFLDVVRRMGADVFVEPGASGAGEPAGRITVRGGVLRGTTVCGAEIPNLIDELPLVAVLGALAEGSTAIRDARELRVKESDRIATVLAGLRAFGVAVTEYPDGLCVQGPVKLCGSVEVRSMDDHRIAMAMSLLGLRLANRTRVVGTACVATSYPGFWDHLEQLSGVRAEELA